MLLPGLVLREGTNSAVARVKTRSDLGGLINPIKKSETRVDCP